MRPNYKNSEAKIQREISRWKMGDLLAIKEQVALENEKQLVELYLKKNSRCLFLGEIKERAIFKKYALASKFWVKVTNGKKIGWIPARFVRLITQNKRKPENE